VITRPGKPKQEKKGKRGKKEYKGKRKRKKGKKELKNNYSIVLFFFYSFCIRFSQLVAGICFKKYCTSLERRTWTVIIACVGSQKISNVKLLEIVETYV